MDKIFYCGTCRYQYIFKNNFAPRLHTTREILNFLEKYINKTINFENNIEFGDCRHPSIINDANNFIINDSLFKYDTFVIEISSKKLAYSKNIDDKTPYNYFYICENLNNYNLDHYNIITLTDYEIIEDIKRIKNILQNHFNIKKLIIIPHINLKLRDSNLLIEERNNLYNLLININYIDYIDNLYIINLSKYLENYYLEDILPDYYHYKSDDIKDLIYKYIENYIKNNII